MIEDPNLDCFKIYKKMQPCAHVYMCIYICWMVPHAHLYKNASLSYIARDECLLGAKDVETERAKYQQVADGFLDAKLIFLVCRTFHFSNSICESAQCSKLYLGVNSRFKTLFGSQPHFQNFLWGSTQFSQLHLGLNPIFKTLFGRQPTFQNSFGDQPNLQFSWPLCSGCLRHMSLSSTNHMMMRRYLGPCLLGVVAVESILEQQAGKLYKVLNISRPNLWHSEFPESVTHQNAERISEGSIPKFTAIHSRQRPMCIPLLPRLIKSMLTRLWMRTSQNSLH